MGFNKSWSEHHTTRDPPPPPNAMLILYRHSTIMAAMRTIEVEAYIMTHKLKICVGIHPRKILNFLKVICSVILLSLELCSRLEQQ